MQNSKKGQNGMEYSGFACHGVYLKSEILDHEAPTAALLFNINKTAVLLFNRH